MESLKDSHVQKVQISAFPKARLHSLQTAP